MAAIAPPPKAWSELRDRYDAFLEFDATPLQDRLIEAVVNGGTEGVPTLKAWIPVKTSMALRPPRRGENRCVVAPAELGVSWCRESEVKPEHV